jgi:uracil-DNA glycosylase
VSDMRRDYLAQLDVDVYVRRDAPGKLAMPGGAAISGATSLPEPHAEAAAPLPDQSPRRADIATMDWPALRRTVAACTLCGLHATRTQTVFGVGDENADWLVIGEAPGAEEDARGEPFVGRAGGLLNSMLAAIGLKREQVFIANILKCRPPGNRDPRPEEALLCRPFLERQIALIAPKIILAVGRIAAQNLLATETPIGKLRGRSHHFGAARTPLVVTYHPAYLLRSPGEKRKAWADLKLAVELARGGRTQ